MSKLTNKDLETERLRLLLQASCLKDDEIPRERLLMKPARGIWNAYKFTGNGSDESIPFDPDIVKKSLKGLLRPTHEILDEIFFTGSMHCVETLRQVSSFYGFGEVPDAFLADIGDGGINLVTPPPLSSVFWLCFLCPLLSKNRKLLFTNFVA